MKILAFDPGSHKLGWGIVYDGKYLNFGTIKVPGNRSLTQRIYYLNQKITDLVFENLPINYFVCEEVHVRMIGFQKNSRRKSKSKINLKTSLILSNVVGILHLIAGKCAQDLNLLSPKEIKKAITGNGNASKPQVQAMVKRELKLDKRKTPSEDAADALAAAMTFWRKLQAEKVLSHGKD